MDREAKLQQVVTITNILNKPYTVRYDGRDIQTIPVGATVPMVYYLAEFVSVKMANEYIYKKHGALSFTRKPEIFRNVVKLILHDEDITAAIEDNAPEEVEEVNKREIVNDADEALRRELQKENNPKVARAEELNEMKYHDLNKMAKGIEGWGAKMKKNEVIELILNDEYRK